MAVVDPALGLAANFDATAFQNGVRFAMQMGAPPDAARRATFVFPSTGRTFWKGDEEVTNPRCDRDGSPLDPDVEVKEVAPVAVTVDCSVDMVKAEADELPVGNFRDTKAIVTVLGDDFDKIDGCKEMRFNGDRYAFGYTLTGQGLFEVPVFTLIFYALDES